MNKTRKILFRLGAAVLVALIIALMFWLGRGHTVYLDSKALDVDGVLAAMKKIIGEKIPL